jgi:HEAT repeat protein
MAGSRGWLSGWLQKLANPLPNQPAPFEAGLDQETETALARRELDKCFPPDADYCDEQNLYLCEANYRAALGDVDIQPFLLSAAQPDGPERAEALIRIGHHREEPDALTLMTDALSSRSPQVRAAAARGLLHYRDAAAVPALSQALASDESAEVRRWAAMALGLLKSPDGVPALMSRVGQGEVREQVAVIRALGNIHDPVSFDLVRAALATGDDRIRAAAEFALASYDFERRNQGKMVE